MSSEHVRKRTRLSVSEWLTAMDAAWLEANGAAAPIEVLGLLWAQFAVETGRGASCWNYNLGNKRAVDGEDYFVLAGAVECGDPNRLPAGAVLSPSGGIQCPPGQVSYLLPAKSQRFAAYASALDGARAHLKFLMRPSYAGVWFTLVRGDARAFAHALKLRGYYTASEQAYAAGLVSLQNEFVVATKGQRDTQPDAVDASEAVTRPETPTSISAPDFEVIVDVRPFIASLADPDEVS